MLWGLFQEALEAMFALINEMEMAIKINTAIIFANRAHIIGVKLNCLRVGWCLSEGGKKKPGEEILPQHERVLRPLHFVAGRVKRLFLVYFKPAVFKSDRKQVSSSIHSLWVSLGCCKQHEIFVWEHHHGSSILAMATGHKGFPMCSTRWEGVSLAGARGPVKQELCCVLTVAMFE